MLPRPALFSIDLSGPKTSPVLCSFFVSARPWSPLRLPTELHTSWPKHTHLDRTIFSASSERSHRSFQTSFTCTYRMLLLDTCRARTCTCGKLKPRCVMAVEDPAEHTRMVQPCNSLYKIFIFKFLRHCVTDPMIAEAMALHHSVIFAKLLGFLKVTMETDCLEVVSF